MTDKAFGDRVREARKICGLTQADLATACEVSMTSIGYYERGERRPSWHNLRRLSSLLGVSIDHLLGVGVEVREE